MGDLIERSVALRKFIEGDGDDRFTEGYNFAVEEYRKKITEIPSVNRWIPVSERMPETPYEGFGVHFYYSDCVLVAGKDWLGMAYYVNDNGESRWEFADARTKQVIDWVEITHWMPITPPESEVHDG